MPHQCLKCGKIFPEGAPTILKGCPLCGGTKFFYTEKKLTENERKKLATRAEKDVKSLIRDVLAQRIPEKESPVKKWVKVEPKKTPLKKEKLKMEKVKKSLLKLPEREIKEVKPEVIDIKETGIYEIDVKSLLERSPIVVRRDGTYLMHLPSLFEKLTKKST